MTVKHICNIIFETAFMIALSIFAVLTDNIIKEKKQSMQNGK